MYVLALLQKDSVTEAVLNEDDINIKLTKLVILSLVVTFSVVMEQGYLMQSPPLGTTQVVLPTSVKQFNNLTNQCLCMGLQWLLVHMTWNKLVGPCWDLQKMQSKWPNLCFKVTHAVVIS